MILNEFQPVIQIFFQFYKVVWAAEPYFVNWNGRSPQVGDTILLRGSAHACII